MVLEVKVSNGPEQSAPAPRRAGVVSARLPPGNPNRFSSGPVLMGVRHHFEMTLEMDPSVLKQVVAETTGTGGGSGLR